MPPKLRRPAAAKARAKVAAAPDPGARVRRRLRRPAAHEEAVGEEPRGGARALLRGELEEANKVPLDQLAVGTHLVFEGTYWGAQCRL